MIVSFDIDIMGRDVTIVASANDVNEYSEALNLRIKVSLPDGSLIPLHQFVDDIDEVERITQATLDELYSNKYEGELALE